MNALQGDGLGARGFRTRKIEAGMDVDEVARRIVSGIEANAREIVVAQGAELAGIGLRATDPDRLFDYLAQEGERLARAREAAGGGFRPEPARVV